MHHLATLVSHDDPSNLLLYSVRTVVVLAFGILCIRIAGRTTFSQLSPLEQRAYWSWRLTHGDQL